MMDEKDNVLDPQEETVEVGESGAVEDVDSVSSGDSVLFDMRIMNDIAYDVQALADSSIQGYLSSSIVQVFDRLVDNGDYRYYCAYRPSDGDSNSGVLYLSNDMDGTQLNNSQVIRMYRSSADGDDGFNYFYDVSYDDSEDFYFGNGALYYTNMTTGYPALGSVKESKMLSWFPIFAVVVFLSAVIIRRKIKEC